MVLHVLNGLCLEKKEKYNTTDYLGYQAGYQMDKNYSILQTAKVRYSPIHTHRNITYVRMRL